jgi:hypothetical protein
MPFRVVDGLLADVAAERLGIATVVAVIIGQAGSLDLAGEATGLLADAAAQAELLAPPTRLGAGALGTLVVVAGLGRRGLAPGGNAERAVRTVVVCLA